MTTNKDRNIFDSLCDKEQFVPDHVKLKLALQKKQKRFEKTKQNSLFLTIKTWLCVYSIRSMRL